MQPFSQSATFKLLSLRFNLMITFNHHIKFFKSVIFEGTSFRPKNFACYAKGADVALLNEKNSNSARDSAIPPENVLLSSLHTYIAREN